MLFHISEGQHAAEPKQLKVRWRPKRFHFDVTFHDGRYHLRENGKTDVDQYDWNKLCGLSFHLFTNHHDSFMIGWRYNLDTKRIELNRYQHRNGEVVFDKQPFGTIHPQGGRVRGEARINYDRKQVRVSVFWHQPKNPSAEGHTGLEYRFDTMPKITREINLWFGGNEPAPKTMFFLKETGY